MKHVTAFCSAAVLLVLFCAGHTGGGMLAQRSLGADSDAVFASMKAVTFVFNGAHCTWYGFWFGFGLVCSVFLLLSAGMAWQLDRVPPQGWRSVAPIAWMLVVANASNAALTWVYFFAGAGTLATVVTVLLAVGTWRKGHMCTAMSASNARGASLGM